MKTGSLFLRYCLSFEFPAKSIDIAFIKMDATIRGQLRLVNQGVASTLELLGPRYRGGVCVRCKAMNKVEYKPTFGTSHGFQGSRHRLIPMPCPELLLSGLQALGDSLF